MSEQTALLLKGIACAKFLKKKKVNSQGSPFNLKSGGSLCTPLLMGTMVL